jgi:phage terminase large subunit-like protein
MAESRIGRQTPTQSVVLPYTETHGEEAIKLYNSSGATAMEWQELQIYDQLAINDHGLWVHMNYGFAVPRRNGKSEILIMRALYGLEQGERILYTAHRTDTAHAVWERLYEVVKAAKLEISGEYRAYGKEHIYVAGGGRIEFRTRTSKGGLGTGYDLLMIDEAQEYQNDQQTSLTYVVTDSKNPQTIYCGTPPTLVSSGDVFQKMRKDVLSGDRSDTGWAEWSVNQSTDVHDKDAWYETNPSLGITLTERNVNAEIKGDDVDFNIQRLGLWLTYNQKSVITEVDWNACKVDVLPKLTGKLYVGIKFGNDGTNAAMSIAVKSGENVFIESIDIRAVRSGTRWILDFLKKARVASVVIDGENGQKILTDQLSRAKLSSPVLPRVPDIIKANAEFEQAVFGKTLIHMEQPSLDAVVTNCDHRAIGSNGGFGYKSLDANRDIALLDSVVLAHWACIEGKGKKAQKIWY